ncbi:MAG: hypothetical protein JXR97_03770 [Planctomycetes bacterium]|nr:hypothetical protein [Planctomycetota bacterium]
MKKFRLFIGSVMLGFFLIAAGNAICGEEKAEAAVEKVDTPANRALDQKVSIEKENATLTDMLIWFEEQGVQYIINMKVAETKDELIIKVKDLPLREVIEITAASAGYKLKVSKSGIVTFIHDAEQVEAQKAIAEQNRMDMFRNMMGRRGGEGRPGEGRPGGDKRGGRQGNNDQDEQPNKDGNQDQPKQDDKADKDGKAGVF